LGGLKPMEGQSVNAYEFKGNKILKYKRFNDYIVSYVISVISLGILALLLRKK
jgi:hypothetical protein